MSSPQLTVSLLSIWLIQRNTPMHERQELRGCCHSDGKSWCCGLYPCASANAGCGWCAGTCSLTRQPPLPPLMAAAATMWWLAARRKPLIRREAGMLLTIPLQTPAAPESELFTRYSMQSRPHLHSHQAGLACNTSASKWSLLGSEQSFLSRDGPRCTRSVRALAYPPYLGGISGHAALVPTSSFQGTL